MAPGEEDQGKKPKAGQVLETFATVVYFGLVPLILAWVLALQRSVVDTHQIIDITVPVRAGMPQFGKPEGLQEEWRKERMRIKDGDHVRFN